MIRVLVGILSAAALSGSHNSIPHETKGCCAVRVMRLRGGSVGMGQEWLRSAGGEGFHKGNRTPLSVANTQIPVRAADGNDSPPSVASPCITVGSS
jgi:hypothetical protein